MEEGSVEAVIDQSRRKPNPKNRVDPAIEEAVLAFSLESPAQGQVRVGNDLRTQGVFVSASGVCSIWILHKLQNPKLRLKLLEKKMAEGGLKLTEAKVVAMERQESRDEAHGEIETEHPGNLGSQDAYYVGTIKGIGRIYQQTFMDTFSKVAACKPYTTKTPITAADLPNDRVLLMLADQGIARLHMLTNRGEELYGPVLAAAMTAAATDAVLKGGMAMAARPGRVESRRSPALRRGRHPVIVSGRAPSSSSA